MADDKKTPEVVRSEVAQLKKKLELLREQARERGMAFSSLDEEQLTRKVRGETSKSPFIMAQAWISGTSPGSTAYYNVYVHNPDPNGYFPVYGTIFFGLGNFFEAGLAWTGRDKRWPEFSSDRTLLDPNSDHTFSFSYTVPSGLPLGTYNGNSVVWRGDWHDVGGVFDRGSFDVKLS